MDAPMPLPANPPALHAKPTVMPGVYRVCDENGCRLVRGFVNPPAAVPSEAPMPMPSARVTILDAPMPRPLANFVAWFDSHRPRLLERLFARRR